MADRGSTGIMPWTREALGATILTVGVGRNRQMNRVEIFKGWCKKCGICIAFCPRGVLTTGDDGFPKVKNPDACTGCRWCELRCPDFAIVVQKDEHTDNA